MEVQEQQYGCDISVKTRKGEWKGARSDSVTIQSPTAGSQEGSLENDEPGR